MPGYYHINDGSGWGNRRYTITEYVVFQIFPDLPKIANSSGRRRRNIELYDLEGRVNHHFPTINIHKIGEELRRFLDRLNNSRTPQEADHCISMHIQQRFDLDLNFPGSRLGLPNARLTFTVLAAFAFETSSSALADILLSTFWRCRHAIPDQKPNSKLLLWLTALNLLRTLVPYPNLDRCIRFLSNRHNHVRHHYRSSGRFDPQMERLLDKMDRMLQEMDRGRAFDRALAYPRARTLPPVRPVPMLMPAPAAWASAYSSPVVRPYDGWVPEAEMDEMKQRIEDLEVNQQVQGMQLGLGPPSLMDALALGWHGLD